MNSRALHDAVHPLLTTINLAAPTGRDQQEAVQLLSACRKDNLSDLETLRRLTGFLYDGLAYGNWPSNLAKLNQE